MIFPLTFPPPMHTHTHYHILNPWPSSKRSPLPPSPPPPKKKLFYMQTNPTPLQYFRKSISPHHPSLPPIPLQIWTAEASLWSWLLCCLSPSRWPFTFIDAVRSRRKWGWIRLDGWSNPRSAPQEKEGPRYAAEKHVSSTYCNLCRFWADKEWHL